MHVPLGLDFIRVCLSQTVMKRIYTARQVAFISYNSAIHVLSLLGNSFIWSVKPSQGPAEIPALGYLTVQLDIFAFIHVKLHF